MKKQILALLLLLSGAVSAQWPPERFNPEYYPSIRVADSLNLDFLNSSDTTFLVRIPSTLNLEILSISELRDLMSAALAYTDSDAISAVRDSVSLDDVANVNDTTDNRLVIANYDDVEGKNILFSVLGDTVNNTGTHPVSTILIDGSRSTLELKSTISDGRLTNIGTALALITDNSGHTIQIRPNNSTQAIFNSGSGTTFNDEVSVNDNFLNFGQDQFSSAVRGTARIYSASTNEFNGLLKVQVKQDSSYQDAVTIDSTGATELSIKSGATANRPAAPKIGTLFFDISLSPARLIIFNGSAWVNVDGTAL